MAKLLCPSMMCADYRNLEREIKDLEEAGIDIFHIDLMDGSFVPNFGMGLQDIELITKIATKPCDIHLMCMNPSKYIEKFVNLGIKIIYVHPESDLNISRTLQQIKDLGACPGIVISPSVSFETIKELLYLVDYVLVMSVNPGFAGQKYLNYVDKKIEKIVNESPNYGGYKVMLDGACSPDVINRLSKIGVEGFILGTSALFGKNKSYKELCLELRKG